MSVKKFLNLTLLFCSVTFTGAFMFSESHEAHANGAFRCQPGFYQVIDGQLNILNPVSGVYTPIGADLDDYNAIGFNPVDNYIYGWGSGTNGPLSRNVLKIDSSGAVTTLGNAGQTQSFISADFDDEGFLWMRKADSVMLKVDVRNNPATATDITFTGSNLIGADMGWINDVLYSVDGTTLMRADLNALTVSYATITDLGSPVGKEFPTSGPTAFGAVFSNRADELYASHNDTGRIYRITDYTTSNPRATWVVDATRTSNNDGAACKLAPSPFDSPTSTNDSYSTTSDQSLTVPANGVFGNDGASNPTVSSFTNPTSGTLALNNDGSFTYTPNNGFIGTDTFTYTGVDQWGRMMPAATVTITVTAPINTAAIAPTTTIATASTLPRSGSSSALATWSAIWLVMSGAVLWGGTYISRRMRKS